MSFSINHSPYVKVDTAPNDQPSLTPPAAKTPLSGSTPVPPVVSQNAAWNSQRDMMISSGALSKLFDMLEQVFKTLREMLSGKNITPDLTSGADKAPKVKPDADAQKKVIPDTLLLPKVTPHAADKSEVKPELGLLPKVGPEARDQLKVKIDDGVLRVITPKPMPRDVPAVPQPNVNVTNEVNPQIKVEVNVNHCHCPDTNAEHEKGWQPRIKPDAISPDHRPLHPARPNSEVRVIPDAKPRVLPKPGLKPLPGITPHPDAKVVPDTKPGVLPTPDQVPQLPVTPLPDATIAPEIDTQPQVTPDVPKPRPDVTSPGPAENPKDLMGRSFIKRRRLGA